MIAALLSGFLLLILAVGIEKIKKSLSLKMKEKEEIVAFYVLPNMVAIWLIARLANLTGFGIVSFWVAVILGAFVGLWQKLLWSLKKK